MSVLPFRIQTEVRYAESDQMGVVYHANYLTWFEMSRTKLFRTEGYDYRRLEADGIFLPVVEVHCRYNRPACYGDLITIECNGKREGKIQLRFDYRCLNEEEIQICSGFTLHAFMNKAGKPIRIPNSVVEFLEKIGFG